MVFSQPQTCPVHVILSFFGFKVVSAAHELLCIQRLIGTELDVIAPFEMPSCAANDKFLCSNAPLDGRHFCTIFKNQLHGPCGEFNGDDSAITYCNCCFI